MPFSSVPGILSRHFLMHSLGKSFQRTVRQNTLFKPLNAMSSNLTFSENGCHLLRVGLAWKETMSVWHSSASWPWPVAPESFHPLLYNQGPSKQTKNTSLWSQASTLWCQTVWSGYRDKLTLTCCTQRLIRRVDALIRGLSSPPCSRRQLRLESKSFVFIFPKFLLGLTNGSQTKGTSAIASVASWQMILLGI